MILQGIGDYNPIRNDVSLQPHSELDFYQPAYRRFMIASFFHTTFFHITLFYTALQEPATELLYTAAINNKTALSINYDSKSSFIRIFVLSQIIILYDLIRELFLLGPPYKFMLAFGTGNCNFAFVPGNTNGLPAFGAGIVLMCFRSHQG